MSDKISALFCDNPNIREEIDAFLAQNVEFLQAKCAFYETAQEIAKLVGFDLYNVFEQRFAYYNSCSAEAHYLFGLGLRQEILQALGV